LKSIHILVLATLILINRVNGQTYQLHGVLKDSATKETLAFATIVNSTLNVSKQSKVDGSFTIELQIGYNQLVIQHVGCNEKVFTLFAKNNKDTIILMAHHQHDLEELLVVAFKTKLINLEKDKLKYEDIVVSATKPISSILDKLPGVGSLKTGFSISKPMINGMYGSRVITLNHGLKQEGQQWGQEHGLEIDPYNTGQITLIKGAETLKYTSDAIGGILLIEPLYKANDTLQMNISSAVVSNGRQGNLAFSVEKKLTKSIGFRLHGSVKKAGNFKTPDYYLPNSGFEEQNASLTFKWQKNKHLALSYFGSIFHNKPAILSTSHIGNLTDLQKIISGEVRHEKGSFTYALNRPYQQIHHWLNKLKITYEFSPTFNLDLVYGYQMNIRKEYDRHNYDKKGLPSLDFSLNTHQIDLGLNKTFAKSWQIKSGLNFIYQTNECIGRYFIPNYKRIEGFNFGIIKYKKRKSEFEAGYRVGKIKMEAFIWENGIVKKYPNHYAGVAWQAGWLLKINHDWQMALQFGLAWRNPNVSELYSYGLHHGAAAIEYGNQKLLSEKANSINGIIKYRHNKTLLEWEIFIKRIENYIYLRPKFPAELTIRGAFPAFVYEQTNALFYGCDLLFTQIITPNISFTEKVSLLNVDDLKHSNYINGIPPYQLVHGFNYQLKSNKRLINSKLKLNLTNVFKQNRYTNQTDYLPPPKAYFMVDFSAETNFKKHPNLLLFLSADNCLNKNYRSYLNRFRYFADENGRSITLGLNIKI
jgi:iron complex outermembrane receptor protein